MKRRAHLILPLLALWTFAPTAHAELLTPDTVPAATLLLPYFEVDLDDPNGRTTLLSINNAAAEPALAHVTLWTDWSVHTLDFDIFLTGYDVVTINLRDLFDGSVPQTADAQNDPDDTISPLGPLSLDGSFPGCQQHFPLGDMSELRIDHNRAAHTGQLSPLFGACAGFDHGDNIARGYITVDSVSQCSLIFPPNPGYFLAGGQGIANNDNVLWGDFFYVDPDDDFAQGHPLVHIEACDGPGTCPFLEPSYTFYARYTLPPGLGADEREPLPTRWAARYLGGEAMSAGTDLVVWRDSGMASSAVGYACGTEPEWFPLNETQVVAFDEAEQSAELCQLTNDFFSPPIVDDPTCFPLETGRYSVGAEPLATPFEAGWLYLDLNTLVTFSEFPQELQGITQSWVGTILSAEGRYSVGFGAIALDNAFTASGGMLPQR